MSQVCGKINLSLWKWEMQDYTTMGGRPKDLSCKNQVDSDLVRLMQTTWGWESGTCHSQIKGLDQ